MPDVAKLKKRALEFEQKKQFDKALDTYTQVLAELDEHVDEADVALYNRVGDLLLRRGDVGDAVDHYEKAVDLYTDGGFFNNAIALCNKILRNAPGRNSVYYKLGKISARKGFINDAKQNFLEYADRMQKSGQLEEAFRALKEFADLCPDQDDIRLMLADQLVRKDRKSEAIEQLHALYEKFSAEGRSAEARATVDRMKALDPALEPKETARPAPAKRDLVFLDVNYDETPRPSSSAPAASPSAPPAKPPTAWTVVHPTTPSETQSVAIEMPQIDPDEDILIDLEAPRANDIEQLPGLSHGALLPDDSDAVAESIVSHVDLGLITGFQDSAVAADDAASNVAPLAELESTSHLEPPHQNDAASLGVGSSSIVEEPGLEHLTPVEPSPGDQDEDVQGTADLPMLDVVFDDIDDTPLGGSLTFITLDDDTDASASMLPELTPFAADIDDVPLTRGAAELQIEPTPELEPILEGEPTAEVEPALEPHLEHATEVEVAREPESEPHAETAATSPAPSRVSAPVPQLNDLGETIDVESTPTLEMDAAADEHDPTLRMLDLDVESTSSFDAEQALAGLPMLEPEQHTSFPDEETEEAIEATTEPAWAPEAADEAQPVVPAPSRDSGPVVAPTLTRVEELRHEMEQNPAAWDLHRQLAEALLEEGDREGGIAELETTMFGYEHEGNLAKASQSADELIRVEPNAVRYHQKRVEYAVRANDKPQLVDAYLSLAESLFRSGQLDKSRAVYGRVIELSPADSRAASALRELGVPADPSEQADETQLQSEAALASEPALESKPAPHSEPAPEPARPAAARTPTPVSVSAVPDAESLPLAAEVERTTSPLSIDDDLFAALETALPEPTQRASSPPPVRPPAAPTGDQSFVNLSEWLRDDEPQRSTSVAAGAGENDPDGQQDFADMLTKFKQGVTSNVDDTDHESHYDLGIAYKEMGLLDEAISEFQKALRGTEQRVRTYEALGQCFVEKRQYQIAMTILLRALNDAAADDETLVGVLYLLGYASESLQNWEDAVAYYERVFTVDIQFRDVGERLSAVERKAK